MDWAKVLLIKKVLEVNPFILVNIYIIVFLKITFYQFIITYSKNNNDVYYFQSKK